MRARGQVVVLVAAALPVLLGFLGLALDGGYYFAARGAVQFAADAAAHAAAQDVQLAQAGNALYYGRAATDGQTVGRNNVVPLELTAITVEIAYNDSATAAPTSSGWYTTLPTSNTRAVRATVRAQYPTLFLKLLGIPLVGLERTAVVSLGGSGLLPLAVCVAEMQQFPAGPWTIYQNGSSLCRPAPVLLWDGLVNIDNQRNCGTGNNSYYQWIVPRPSAPAPPGTTVTLDTRGCSGRIDNWVTQAGYTSATILVVDTSTVLAPLFLQATVKGCRDVQLAIPRNNVITATPLGPVRGCSALVQTY
ncbi:MAG TPA: pilus assembly protein TadG-related protein [Chloroflexota bacterium]|nr:pilus assembly protein TadG-related protein [Chloroflexota bacterium]